MNMPEKMKLSAIRKNRGLSQKDLAELLGISNKTLCNWETGKTFPKQPMIERLCEILGVPYDFIDFIA